MRGLIGARFLDARSVPRSKERGFQTLRHKVVQSTQQTRKLKERNNLLIIVCVRVIVNA
ncbi:MAG: hypothetical protein AABX96_02770 [Nanoarchaeota archaeon]